VVEAAVRRMVSERIYSTSVDISPEAFRNSMATQVELGNLKSMPAYDTIVSRRYIRAALGDKP